MCVCGGGASFTGTNYFPSPMDVPEHHIMKMFYPSVLTPKPEQYERPEATH